MINFEQPKWEKCTTILENMKKKKKQLYTWTVMYGNFKRACNAIEITKRNYLLTHDVPLS